MVKIDRRRKFLATTFLRALGLSLNEDIKNKFRDIEADGKTSFIETPYLRRTTNATEALIEFSENASRRTSCFGQSQRKFSWHVLNNRRYDLGAVGRYKMNKKLEGTTGFYAPDLETKILTVEDVIGTISFLLNWLRDKTDWMILILCQQKS